MASGAELPAVMQAGALDGAGALLRRASRGWFRPLTRYGRPMRLRRPGARSAVPREDASPTKVRLRGARPAAGPTFSVGAGLSSGSSGPPRGSEPAPGDS